MNEKTVYDCRFSSALDDKFIHDFITVTNKVFSLDFQLRDFENMYLHNIYGDSVLVVVYVCGVPSAARALWRNDVDGCESYQLCNVCVAEQYRGRGIVTQMTSRAMSMVSRDALFYSFPNTRSYPIYIAKGWKLIRAYYLMLLTSNSKYAEEHPVDAGTAYINWFVKHKQNIYYISRGGTYYLVCKHPRPFCYVVLSRVSRGDALKFKKLSILSFVFYNTTKKVWYNKSFVPLHVVAHSCTEHYLPVWKMDAI